MEERQSNNIFYDCVDGIDNKFSDSNFFYLFSLSLSRYDVLKLCHLLFSQKFLLCVLLFLLLLHSRIISLHNVKYIFDFAFVVRNLDKLLLMCLCCFRVNINKLSDSMSWGGGKKIDVVLDDVLFLSIQFVASSERWDAEKSCSVFCFFGALTF